MERVVYMVSKDGRNKKEIESILNAGFLHKTDTRLAPELTKELYSDRNRVSVTRLENLRLVHMLIFKLRTAAFRPGRIWV